MCSVAPMHISRKHASAISKRDPVRHRPHLAVPSTAVTFPYSYWMAVDILFESDVVCHSSK